MGLGMSGRAEGDAVSTDMESKLADVLAREMFIRSQGWSEWPTLEELQADAPKIITALGEATSWGGFNAWDEGTKRVTKVMLDSMKRAGDFAPPEPEPFPPSIPMWQR